MWIARRRHRAELDLTTLDRLSETIARAVALIEERLAPLPPARHEARHDYELVIRREPDEADSQLPEWEPLPEEDPDPSPEPVLYPVTPELPRPQLGGFVLFVPTVEGYRLAMPDGVVPERGERLSVEDSWYHVVRLGPSPLPGDARRCVFLEAQTATLD